MRRVLHLSLGKRGVGKDVDAELRFHLEMRTEEFIAEGLDPRSARAAAEAAFGDTKKIKNECRRIRQRHVRRRQSLVYMRDLAQDLRLAFRSLGKSPGFTTAVLVTLALGIGANTAVFSLVNGVLLRPLPYTDGSNLVHLRQPAMGVGLADAGFSPLEVADYQERSQTFEGVVEYHSMPFTLLGLEEPVRVQTGVVSDDFFDLFGITPLHGRTFQPGEDEIGADPVLVLSYPFWQAAFGSDPGVVGRQMEMNDRIHTVVGVLPSMPQYPDENDVYMPVSSCPFRSGEGWSTNRNARGLDVFARLKSEGSLDEARGELGAIAGTLHGEHPEHYSEAARFETSAITLREELVSNARARLFILLSITGLLLLLVCANVANLTLARLVRREREMAIRAALGAGRGRLFRQLLAEGTVLALVGGALALVLAAGGLDLLISFVARFTTRAAEIEIDRNVLLFTLGVSLVTGLLLGLLPALPARTTLLEDLKEGATSATAGAGRLRARGFLIVSQLAVSFVLLIGAGLLIKSFIKLQNVDPGFNEENVLTARVTLDWTNYLTTDQVNEFTRPLLERVTELPGVVSTSVANSFPLTGQQPGNLAIHVEGQPELEPALRPQADPRAVSPGYFRTMGIPLLRGRSFEPSDDIDEEGSSVAIINGTFARRIFPGEDPIGRRVCWGSCPIWLTIVGAVGDVKQYGLDSEPTNDIYLPFRAAGFRDFRLLARTRGEPLSLAEWVRSAVWELDSTQPVTEVRTLAHVRSDSVAAPRLTMMLLGLFAAIALVITAAGIGGIIAFTVSQRTRELGIRIALGADRWSVVRMVMRQAFVLVLIGLAIGIPAAFGLSRFLSGLLFETEPTDVITFLIVTILLLMVAAVASFAPARRATTIDPIMTLKSE